jgi:hypothetical protein
MKRKIRTKTRLRTDTIRKLEGKIVYFTALSKYGSD